MPTAKALSIVTAATQNWNISLEEVEKAFTRHHQCGVQVVVV